MDLSSGRVLLALLAAIACLPAGAQPSPLEADRRLCSGRHPDEDLKACMKEAAAARAEARRGRLDEGMAAEYRKNELARCGYLRGEDRALCERRMKGEGTVSGSVAGGGLYRELRTFGD